MTRRLLIGYLSIAVLVLIVLEIPLGLTFSRNERERLQVAAERDASVVATLVEEDLEHGAPSPVLPTEVLSYAQRAGARVLVLDRHGISVSDTDPSTALGRDYSSRPEVAAALAGQVVSGERFSDTLDLDLSYVAVPVAHEGGVLGVVRITYATKEVEERIRQNWLQLGLIAAVVLAATVGVGVGVSRWVTRPLAVVRDTAGAFAAGDLTVRAPTDQGPPEVRTLAAEFNVMAERLATLVEAQQAFVTDASHQLRSPLTALRLELEVLEADAGDATRDGLARAQGEVQRLGRLVNGLLVLARADRATRPPEPMDVSALARERADAWAPVAADLGRRVDGPHDGPCSALGVPDYLTQVLDNLIDNGLRASPEGSTLAITVEQVDGNAVLRVIDEGPGMTPEHKRRAFDRFWRAPTEEAGTGTGLGLPIAKRLVEASGGQLRLDDRPGGGLVASIVLPLAQR